MEKLYKFREKLANESFPSLRDLAEEWLYETYGDSETDGVQEDEEEDEGAMNEAG